MKDIDNTKQRLYFWFLTSHLVDLFDHVVIAFFLECDKEQRSHDAETRRDSAGLVLIQELLEGAERDPSAVDAKEVKVTATTPETGDEKDSIVPEDGRRKVRQDRCQEVVACFSDPSRDAEDARLVVSLRVSLLLDLALQPLLEEGSEGVFGRLCHVCGSCGCGQEDRETDTEAHFDHSRRWCCCCCC